MSLKNVRFHFPKKGRFQALPLPLLLPLPVIFFLPLPLPLPLPLIFLLPLLLLLPFPLP